MNKPIRRRDFVSSLIGGSVAAQLVRGGTLPDPTTPELKAGEGTADITPLLGIELGGFHREPGNERCVRGIRQHSFARAIVLQYQAVQVALISLDVCGVGHEMATRVRELIAK